MLRCSKSAMEWGVRDLMARAGSAGVRWLGERAADAQQWLRNLIRFLPARAARLAVTLQAGLFGVLLFAPGGLRAWQRGGRTEMQPWLHSRQQQGSIRLVQLLCRCWTSVCRRCSLVWRGSTHVAADRRHRVMTAVLAPCAALRGLALRKAASCACLSAERQSRVRSFSHHQLPRRPPHATISTLSCTRHARQYSGQAAATL